MQHQILHGQGDQTLRHLPMSPRGIPTRVASATYNIVDLRRANTSQDYSVRESTAAVLAGTSATLTAVAGPGVSAYPSQIIVDDTAGFVAGHTYLITKADGQRQTIVVERIEATVLHASKPLSGPYAVGDTVQAIELQATFPAAEADDEAASVDDGGGPYQLIWSYTLEGQAYLVPEIIWVTRYSTTPFITPDDVIRAYPALASRTGANVYDAISVATEDFEAAVRAAGKDPSYYRPTIEARVALRYRTLEYCHRWMAGDDDMEMATLYADRYQTLISNMLIGNPPVGTVEISPSSDSAKTGPADHNMFFVRP